jgi:hypothetical protein
MPLMRHGAIVASVLEQEKKPGSLSMAMKK